VVNCFANGMVKFRRNGKIIWRNRQERIGVWTIKSIGLFHANGANDDPIEEVMP
jgi:hypothetical protein